MTEPRAGRIDPRVASEFPELHLWELEVDGSDRRSPEEVRDRLRVMSDRFRGPQAVMMRQQPIPHAYRVFFRHIGLDPDVDRTPVEAIALERLKRGRFRSEGLVQDALTIATVETGVPVWAVDAVRIEGPLSIRAAGEGEPLGESGPPLPAGRLVVADARGVVAVLFGAAAPEAAVTRATRRLRLFSVQVAGVPSIHVEEGLWMVEELCSPPERRAADAV